MIEKFAEPNSLEEYVKTLRERKQANGYNSCIGLGAGIFSLILVVTMFFFHWFQFDALAPVTLVPAWMWAFPAFALSWFSFRCRQRLLTIVSIFAWLIFVFVFAEETTSLIRNFRLDGSRQPNAIRVATLNCNVGNRNAAIETKQFDAEIVLLQESPGKSEIAEIAKELFDHEGAHCWGGDASIIVRGKIKPIHVDHASHFVHVTATLMSGRQVDVVSLRLSAPVFRLDFWSLGFWNDHLKKRRHHRTQLRDIRNHLQSNQQTSYLIVGGDFNAVGNDGAFHKTFSDLLDSFRESGAGWGNTGTNETPLFRVDQIWSSKNMECVQSRAHRTKFSDHRMVVSDFQITR